tara:strand:+ start:490 stop:681 length:192 start_codon:yes stop_codon:yes gene_type:complete
MSFLAASNIIVKSPNGSTLDSQLLLFFIKLKNFLEKTFVQQSESETGLFMMIDNKRAKHLLPI